MNNKLYYNGTCYRLTGDVSDKPVIAILHGVGLKQDIWDEWVLLLEKNYTVLTYDFLGHGGSENPAGPRSLSDFVEQLAMLTNYLKIDDFTLIGFSLGALVAQGFAIEHGSRLNHLVLLHSVFQRTPEQNTAIESRYFMTRDQGPMATVEVAIERWFSQSFIANNTDVIDATRQTFREHTDDGYLKAYRLFCDADEELDTSRLKYVDCPALVITGSAETGSTVEMSHALSRELKNGRPLINEGHQHMAPVEHAEKICNQVISFIRGVE